MFGIIERLRSLTGRNEPEATFPTDGLDDEEMPEEIEEEMGDLMDMLDHGIPPIQQAAEDYLEHEFEGEPDAYIVRGPDEVDADEEAWFSILDHVLDYETVTDPDRAIRVPPEELPLATDEVWVNLRIIPAALDAEPWEADFRSSITDGRLTVPEHLLEENDEEWHVGDNARVLLFEEKERQTPDLSEYESE